MKIAGILSAGVLMSLCSVYGYGQCCKSDSVVCQVIDEGPRPTCGAPYNPQVYDRPVDPDMDPFRGMNVTEAQKEKIRKAIEKRDDKAEKIRSKMEKERAKNQAQFDKEVRKILSDSQYGQFRQNIGGAVVRRFVAKPTPGPQPQLMK